LRRLQFVDEQEQAQLLHRLQNELHQMLDDLQRYMRNPRSVDPDAAATALEATPTMKRTLHLVQAKIGSLQSVDEVDEITEMLEQIWI
jgi:23S rRNA maturation mini-RNase III